MVTERFGDGEMSGDFELDELRDEMRVRSERAEMRHEDELASLRRQVATLSEACRELIEHAEWDGTTDAAAAIERARAALAATEETP